MGFPSRQSPWGYLTVGGVVALVGLLLVLLGWSERGAILWIPGIVLLVVGGAIAGLMYVFIDP